MNASPSSRRARDRGAFERRRPGRHLVLAGIGALVAFSGVGLVAAAEEDGPIGVARQTVREWVGLRKEIARERSNWADGREALEQRIKLAQSEVDDLRQAIEDASKQVREGRATSEEQIKLRDGLKAGLDVIDEAVEPLEARARELLTRLPETALSAIAPYTAKLPDDSENASANSVSRVVLVTAILNELHKLNRRVDVTREKHAVEGGAIEADTLHIGLGHAFYVSNDNTKAGVGRATSSGWTWTVNNSAAEAIREAINVFERKADARFIELPVNLSAGDVQ